MKPLVVLPLVLVAACGGGSSSSATKGDAAARTAYIAKAEAICATANTAQKALVKPATADQIAPYVDGVVMIATTATTSLAALTPPAADKADLQKHVLGPLTSQLVKAKQYAADVDAASKAHDNTKLSTLITSAPTQTVADLSWMRAYGFKECVDAADTSG